VAAVTLTLPLCIREITRRLLSGAWGNASKPIILAGLFMLALIAAQCCCEMFRDLMGHVMGARMERDMRNRLFIHYQSLGFSFFDREKTGSIISRISNDLLSLAELYHHGPEDIIIYFASFIGALCILFRINPRLSLSICAFLPAMVIYSIFFSKKLNRAYQKNRESIAELTARIDDSIAGIRTVKSFCSEEIEAEKFRGANEAFCKSRSSIYAHEAWYYTILSGFITQLITAAVVILGGIMLSRGTLDVADLISFLLYAGYLTAPIPQLARIMAQYQEGLSGFARFMEVLETPGEDSGGAAADRITGRVSMPEKMKGGIEFRNVSFRYDGDRDYVLKNVSFTIRGGEYVALSGPSGIGKTTLCSLIPRFYAAQEGAILLDGIDVRRIGLKELRSRIGVVQQDCYVFAGTIRENIAYGRPGASEEEIINAAKKANAHEFISALPGGYDTVIGRQGSLSGGQRQRLCIARVFLKDPPLLIFDEATSALDMETERVIQEGLRDLSKNRTTIVIAHRISTLRHADRILTLDEDGVKETGLAGAGN
jgi:ATP-binding cassette subfamily B protein